MSLKKLNAISSAYNQRGKGAPKAEPKSKLPDADGAEGRIAGRSPKTKTPRLGRVPKNNATKVR